MDISFITVNYNSSDETLNLINSIHKHTHNLDYEIIVVDNASNPDQLNKLKVLKDDDSIHLIQNPTNSGFAKGNMLGVKQAKGEYYFFLNNDTLLLNDAPNILKEFMEKHPQAALSTAQLYHDEKSTTTSFKKFPSLANKLFGNSLVRLLKKDDFPSNKIHLDSPTKVGVVSGSCMFFRASVFNKIGGLDTDFFLYCEEEDISKRIWDNGFEVYFVPEAKVIHFEGASTQKSYEIEREYYISYNILLNKHFNRVAACLMKMLLVFKLLRRSFRSNNYARLLFFVLRGSPVKESLRYQEKGKAQESEQISAKQWMFIHLSITSLLFGFVYVTNYCVDPFGTRSWLVEKRYKPIIHERNEKYNTIFYENKIENFDCLILGSSRVMQIHPSQIEEIKGCYNFGVHAANNPERLFILQEWLKVKKPSRLFLGLEFYNFHEAHRPLYLDKHSFTDGAAGNYLSFSTLQLSLKSLYYSLTDQPQSFFEQDGSMNYYQDNIKIKKGTYDFSKLHFQQQSKNLIKSNFIDKPYIYKKEALEPLRQIAELCKEHNIDLYPFVTPMQYETFLEIQKHKDIFSINQQIISDLTKLFGKLYDFNGDFSENKEFQNFYDPWHYRPLIGKLIIKRMLGEDSKYGYLRTVNKDTSKYSIIPSINSKGKHEQ